MASSIHWPLPSALNFATYSLPSSRYLSPVVRRFAGLASAASQLALDTNF
jgi:hypothetical protein